MVSKLVVGAIVAATASVGGIIASTVAKKSSAKKEISDTNQKINNMEFKESDFESLSSSSYLKDNSSVTDYKDSTYKGKNPEITLPVGLPQERLHVWHEYLNTIKNNVKYQRRRKF